MQTKTMIYLTSAAGLAAGAAVGYFAAYKAAEKKWQAIAEEEILEVKKMYKMVHDPSEYATKEESDAADRQRTHEYLSRLDNLGYTGDAEPPQPEAPQEETLFETDPRPVHVAKPKESFDETKPFPITSDEYHIDEEDYSKLTLTYYKLDDTLADTRDEVINDAKSIIGTLHKSHMGFDKDEPNIVFVRNHTMQADYEVLLDEGAYVTEVHGIPFEVDSQP